MHVINTRNVYIHYLFLARKHEIKKHTLVVIRVSVALPILGLTLRVSEDSKI